MNVIFALIIFALHSCSSIVEQVSVSYLEHGKIKEYSGFKISYNETYMLANWAEYKISCSDLSTKISRTDNYRPDYQIGDRYLSNADFSGSGYDRGHLVPARDMAFSYRSMSDSFYLTNMVPQNPYFNRNGHWKKTERIGREIACKNGAVRVISGPILREGEWDGNLFVPSHLFKIFYNENIGMIAFKFPNKRNFKKISNFLVSVDELEEITRMDFFSDLPIETQDKLERIIASTSNLLVSSKMTNFKRVGKKEGQTLNLKNFHDSGESCPVGKLGGASIRGCCSGHGGVLGPKKWRACCTKEKVVICKDMSLSASCRCN